MTTPAREALYLAQHLVQWEGKGYAHFNPHGKPLEDLPVIYGFNNGGGPHFYDAVLISEDGKILGGHGCSHEGYMLSDLGILSGSRPDRHEEFKAHYPDGYRMDFVSYADTREHQGLKDAFDLHKAKNATEAA